MAKSSRSKLGGRDLLSGLEALQEELRRAQAELGEQTVEAAAGGGAIRIVMTGTQECRGVKISPDLLREADTEMVQDLVLVAINQALRDSRVLAAQRLGPLAGGAPGFGPGGAGEGGAE
jgi:DNA-binding YbaB/EbfC family protein